MHFSPLLDTGNIFNRSLNTVTSSSSANDVPKQIYQDEMYFTLSFDVFITGHFGSHYKSTVSRGNLHTSASKYLITLPLVRFLVSSPTAPDNAKGGVRRKDTKISYRVDAQLTIIVEKNLSFPATPPFFFPLLWCCLFLFFFFFLFITCFFLR